MSDEKKCGELKCGKVAGEWGLGGLAVGLVILVFGNIKVETSNKPYLFAFFGLIDFILYLYIIKYPIDYNKKCTDLSVWDKLYFMAIGFKFILILGICASLLSYNFDKNVEEMGNNSDTTRSISVGGRRRRR
tara:strand:- start:7235 stop:7630 length:396 start_codon:yes stop_codon:yes gene_type:complete